MSNFVAFVGRFVVAAFLGSRTCDSLKREKMRPKSQRIGTPVVRPGWVETAQRGAKLALFAFDFGPRCYRDLVTAKLGCRDRGRMERGTQRPRSPRQDWPIHDCTLH